MIEEHFIRNQNLVSYFNLEKNILLISDRKKINESVEKCLPLIEVIGEKSFYMTILYVYQNTLSIPLENIIEFLENLQKITQRTIYNILHISKELYKSKNYEKQKNLLFILHQLHHKNYVNKEDLHDIFNDNYPFIFIDIFGKEYYNLDMCSLSKEEKQLIEEGNFELHQKNVSEGHNQDPLLRAIRQDDIDLLQNFLLFSKEKFTQLKVIPSEYERFNIANKCHCGLFEYSALFGSAQIFKYLITNEPNYYNSIKCFGYAIAGGSKDIISIIMNSISINSLSYEIKWLIKVSIKYHQHDIFEWLFESYYNNQYNEKFLKLAFQNNNFSTLFSILKHKFSLFDYFISTIYSNNPRFCEHCIEVMKLFGKEHFCDQMISYLKIYFIICRVSSYFWEIFSKLFQFLFNIFHQYYNMFYDMFKIFLHMYKLFHYIFK